jgi:hypothetical protein
MLTWGLNPIARALSSKVMGRVLKLWAGLSCESPCSPHLGQEKNPQIKLINSFLAQLRNRVALLRTRIQLFA